MGKLTTIPEELLRAHWATFCDCDPLPAGVDYDAFVQTLEDAKLIELREVTQDDLEQVWAVELGIKEGGSVWDLTDLGRQALKETNHG